MHTLRFKKIDAFASQYSTGNPAAVVYLDSAEKLSSAEMLQLAKELKGFVSEVGYVSPGTDTDYHLRYFSSEREVAFCGHATIAILNDIVANSKAMQEKSILSISTMTDRLMVENRYKSEKSVYISAPPARFSSKNISITDIVSAFNCHINDIDQLQPIQIVNGGLATLIVPIAGLESILSVTPDLQTLNKFCIQIGVDIIILYSSETVAQECKYRTRVFAPTFGYLEDPATGSGNSALGYYLLKHGKWDGEMIKIEQNSFRDSPNYVQIFSTETDIENCQVWFGGGAVLRIDGVYVLC
ncbi:PhzF family phenazine biosynthesis protein [Aliiglaciecola sp. 2_MG-2023]|uniref:PhzF family phenazine biosynthesis protein n=1 Tax=unclassified Aliiglaciecola TaxID=2593648 RepID=UPI0026E37AC1|nr:MULTISPECIES: PhzF family phenazine biosynthesis protein [unclassified Aliiglaciecola]MDO6712776.1 PhzF family phenazine biosynthesis protein [Aliiglaciecola sp. 2_MG-2023]MDO6753825.1 PhzF family phenazine biosynthesis protein [Aliiglaciecola sp. 1_MG-2023]